MPDGAEVLFSAALVPSYRTRETSSVASEVEARTRCSP